MMCSYCLQGKMERLQYCLSGYRKYPDYIIKLLLINTIKYAECAKSRESIFQKT